MGSVVQETRTLIKAAHSQLRVKRSHGAALTLEGYAAVFDSSSANLGGFVERFRPGAFRKALKSSDVRALFNRDKNLILGRSTAGTLKLREDAFGLRYVVDLVDADITVGLASSIERRDIAGSAITFSVEEDSWDYSGKIAVRTIISIHELFDVGPSTYPENDDTAVAARSLESNRSRPESSEVVRLKARLDQAATQ